MSLSVPYDYLFSLLTEDAQHAACAHNALVNVTAACKSA